MKQQCETYTVTCTLWQTNRKWLKMFFNNPEQPMGRNSWKTMKILLQLLLFLISHFQKAQTENKITLY